MPRLYKPKPRSNKNPDGSWRVTLPNIRKVVKSLSRTQKERDKDARYLKKARSEDSHKDLERIINRLEKQAAIKKESKKRGKTAR
tara:strand:+ start:314 stop:568 length:255 start_codon:yes stop_codon:yes gene_type:complete